MTNQHPITPPPELRKLWAQQAQRLTPHDINGWLDYVATQAAQWGADQELEACCAEVLYFEGKALAKQIREARRPKPPSLKEQALAAMGRFGANTHTTADEMARDFDTIRRSIEALPND